MQGIKNFTVGICLIMLLTASTLPTLPTTQTVIVPIEPKIEVVATALPVLVVPKVEVSKVIVTTDNDTRQIRCLAENVYHEARGEGTAGQIAVANVVMNRVKDNRHRFPNTPCAVVHQKNRGMCQFSWVCNGRRAITDSALYNKIRNIAEDVYNRDIRDNTYGAMFFHAASIRPIWSHIVNVTVRIRSQVFYKD